MTGIFFFITGVLIFSFFKDFLSVSLIIIAFIFAFVINFKKIKIRKVVVSIILLFAGIGYCFSVSNYVEDKYGNIKEENKELTLFVISKPETQDDKITFTGKIKEYNNKKAQITLHSSKKPSYRDVIKINGNVSSIKSSDNIYSFNSKEYYYSEGIYIKVTSDNEYELIESRKDFFTLMNDFKNKIAYIINMNFSFDNGNLIKGIILGDDSNRSEELDNALVKTGLSHIVVVSGMHFSIINIFLILVLRRLRIGRKLSSLISIVTSVILALFIGLTVSVARALIMLILLNIADLISRERAVDIYSVLLTALIMIVINPFVVNNAGFILSFASVSGIIIFNDKISCRIKIPVKYIKEAVSVSLSANIFTLPFVIYYFNGIPLIFLLSNIIIGIFVPVIMLYSVIVILFSLFSMKFGYYIGIPLDCIMTVIVKVIIMISKIPYGYIKTLMLEKYILVIYFLGIYLIYNLKRKVINIVLITILLSYFCLSLFINVESYIFNYADIYAFCGKDGGKVLICYKDTNIFIDLSVEDRINYNEFIESKCNGNIDICVLGSAYCINNAKNNKLNSEVLYYPKIAYERESLREYIRSFKTPVPIEDNINIKYDELDLTLRIGNSYNISEVIIKIKNETIIVTNDFYVNFTSGNKYIITGKMMEVHSHKNILNCEKEEIERIKI